MQERQVTVDGVTYALPEPFFVLATQNPVELEGTFPLPEAQLDRFLVRVRVGYPGQGQPKQQAREWSADIPVRSDARSPERSGKLRGPLHAPRCCGQECPRSAVRRPNPCNLRASSPHGSES